MMQSLRRLIPYIGRHKHRVGLGLVFITFSNICSTTIPFVVGKAVDTLHVSTFTQEHVLWLIVQILLLTTGSGLGLYGTRRTIIVMSRFVEEDLRNDFLAAIRQQSQRFFHDRSTGSLLAHFSNDIGSVREFIGPAVMYSANTITTFAFALSWMLSINVWLTLAILIPVPLIAWTTYTIGKLIHTRYKIVQEHYEHVTTQAQETFSGIRVVKAYVRTEMESANFTQKSKAYYKKSMSLARVNSLMMPGMTVLFNLSYVIVIGVGGYQVMNSLITVGSLTQFFIYLNQLLWPIAAIGWVTGMIQRGAASMARLGALLDHAPEIKDTEIVDHTIQALRGHVHYSNVSLRYASTEQRNTPHGVNVLSNITLDIPAGTSLGILGGIGSGKSSLVNLIPRLYNVSEGTLSIDGYDVRVIPLSVLRGAVAVVPQESFLFSDTIAGNITFGKPEISKEEMIQASRIAQLHNDVIMMPDGYETVVGERGITLSGGQKQRTALARAIVCQPSILILDDALSAVDTQTEARILEGLKNVMKGRTTIIIAHRVSTLQRCDSIMVLSEGRIVERGSHEELIAIGGQYADTFERQLLEESIG